MRRTNWAMPAAIVLLVAVCFTALGHAQNYTSLGKRDPFVAPRAARDDEPQIVAPPPLDRRPPGLSGLLVSEVTVAGMAGNQQEKVVILKGVDKVSYLAKNGAKLFDGYIQAIGDNEVAFQREVVDTRGNKKVSKVVKRLFTEDK